jgi:hypothetical protein
MHVPLRKRVAALLPFGVVVEPLRNLVHRGSAASPPSDLHPIAALRIEGAADKLPVAIEHAERATRLPSPRPAFQALLHRIAHSDFVTSAQVAAGTGGGRTAAVAALIGVCLSGVGAGTYCVATALLPDPPIVKSEQPATKSESRPHRRTTTHRPTSAPASKPRTMAVATVSATPSPTRRKQSSSQQRTSGSTSKSSAPEREFGFESLGTGTPSSSSQSAATTTSKPSKSSSGSRGGGSGGGGSATSGGEFLP